MFLDIILLAVIVAFYKPKDDTGSTFAQEPQIEAPAVASPVLEMSHPHNQSLNSAASAAHTGQK